MVEVDVKVEIEKLQMEIVQVTGEAQVINNQIQQLQQAGQVKINDLLKKQGALELLNNLNGKKPKG